MPVVLRRSPFKKSLHLEKVVSNKERAKTCVLVERGIQSLVQFKGPYTSPPARPVPLHFISWQTCSFTFIHLADLFLYTSPPGRPVPLHFSTWQTFSFTLHPLADLFLYTSPPGRPFPLHFTPWQTCSFTLLHLADLFLYTSPPLYS